MGGKPVYNEEEPERGSLIRSWKQLSPRQGRNTKKLLAAFAAAFLFLVLVLVHWNSSATTLTQTVVRIKGGEDGLIDDSLQGLENGEGQQSVGSNESEVVAEPAFVLKMDIGSEDLISYVRRKIKPQTDLQENPTYFVNYLPYISRAYGRYFPLSATVNKMLEKLGTFKNQSELSLSCLKSGASCTSKLGDDFPSIILSPVWTSKRNDVARMVKKIGKKSLIGFIDEATDYSIMPMSPSHCIGGAKTTELRCRIRYANKHSCDYGSLEIQPVSWNFFNTSQCENFFQQAQDDPVKFESTIWVMKGRGSLGMGLEIVKGTKRIRQRFNCKAPAKVVVQKYIDKPALFGNRKFDLRTYLLVASTDPLLVFYHDAFVRRSEHVYRTDGNSLTDKKSQITNSRSQSKENHFFSFEQLQEVLTEQDPKTFPRGYMEKVFRPHVKQVQVQMALAANIKPIPGRFQFFACDWVIAEDGSIHLLEGNLQPYVKPYPASVGLTPVVYQSQYELLQKIHQKPESLDMPLLVSEGFHYKRWDLIYNELEAKATHMPYNPCLFKEYKESDHVLYGFGYDPIVF
mmetsp:Transcript_40304/g.64902  ORF Transcript_40304/g.64902 Transcript_40304/m.64902 type:complete len:571 (-) Transcript_40304:3345-5057(-)